MYVQKELNNIQLNLIENLIQKLITIRQNFSPKFQETLLLQCEHIQLFDN